VDDLWSYPLQAQSEITHVIVPEFSVVLFRPNFMLVSEEHPMKTHKNQWLLILLSLPVSLVEARIKAHTLVPEGQTPLQ